MKGGRPQPGGGTDIIHKPSSSIRRMAKIAGNSLARVLIPMGPGNEGRVIRPYRGFVATSRAQRHLATETNGIRHAMD